MKNNSNLGVLLKGIIKENPVLVLILGTCPTLATTTNVAGAFGMGLAALAVLVCSNMLISLLRKIIRTRPQKELSALERSGNLLGVFDVEPTADLEGKTVLLVDDVITTGATLDECAKMLKIYGAGEVYAATAAAALLKDDDQ